MKHLEKEDSLLTAIGLNYNRLQVCKFNNETSELFIKLKVKEHICPFCGHKEIEISDYTTRKIKFAIINDKLIFLKYRQRRYKCQYCRKKFIEDNNDLIDKHRKISRFIENNTYKKLCQVKSYTQIAEDLFISRATVARTRDKVAKKAEKLTLPRVICIDEFKFRRKLPKYSFIIYDYLKRRPIDIVDDRRIKSLETYFESISKKERLKVELIIMDLWNPYRTLIKTYFPRAQIIADKFHVVRYSTKAIRNIRIRIAKEVKESNSKLYKSLKANWRIVQTPYHKLKGNCYNYLKHKITSKVEFIENLCNVCKELQEPLILYNKFNLIINNHYKCETEDVILLLNQFRKDLIDSETLEFEDLISILKNWDIEIANSIIHKNEDKKQYSNGRLEGFNNKLKTLMRSSYGYRNFRSFHFRALRV